MTIDDYMKFSKNLKDFIAKNNLSLKDLADQLEVPSSTVHGWINGVPPKSIKTLKKIALLMNCSIDELCFDERMTTENVDSNILLTIGNVTYRIVLKKHNADEKV
jgi:transcriptional regulator with XRE-family HTH domain